MPKQPHNNNNKEARRERREAITGWPGWPQRRLRWQPHNNNNHSSHITATTTTTTATAGSTATTPTGPTRPAPARRRSTAGASDQASKFEQTTAKLDNIFFYICHIVLTAAKKDTVFGPKEPKLEKRSLMVALYRCLRFILLRIQFIHLFISFISFIHLFYSFIHFICSGACWGTKSSCNWSLWCRCPLQRWVAMARYKFSDVCCNIPCPPVFILYGKSYSIELNSKNRTNWKSYSWMKSLSKNEITPWRQKTLNSLDPYATHLLALETIYRTLTAQAV